MSDGLKILLGFLAGVIVVLLFGSVLGGGGMMGGMGSMMGGGLFGMLFALLFWVLVIALAVWILNLTHRRKISMLHETVAPTIMTAKRATRAPPLHISGELVAPSTPPTHSAQKGRAGTEQEPEVVPVPAPCLVVEREVLPAAKHVDDKYDPGRKTIPESPE